jgi:hypothetical protein
MDTLPKLWNELDDIKVSTYKSIFTTFVKESLIKEIKDKTCM